MKFRKTFIRLSAFVIALIMLASFIFAAVVMSGNIGIASVRANAFAAQTSARAMCTMEVATGRVIYEKNADAKLPMASTTKIVTAITVLENCADIDRKFVIDPHAVGIEGTSIYLQKGETMTVRELLLGLMLRSGNDAAAALALEVCPRPETTPKAQIFDAFSVKMQETALRAGAKNSGFKNPHGLDEDGHYTTARDLALISAYAMKNPVFAEIVATKQAKISGAEYPRVLQNKNRLLNSMDGCIGVKTGFTKKAGRCYVGAAQKQGIRAVSVVLNCGPMFEEARSLLTSALDMLVAEKSPAVYNKQCESTSILPNAA